MAADRNPKLIVDLNKLRNNIEKVQHLCQDAGVEIAGVIKGFTGLPEVAAQFERCGCRFIASSRIEQLEAVKAHGIQTPLMMIRIPMLSEAAEIVRVTDISLNSSVEVLKELNKQAGLQDKKHQVNARVWKKVRAVKPHERTEEDCNEMIDALADVKIECATLEKEYLQKFKEILPAKKLMRVQMAEDRFQRELLRGMQQGRGKKPEEKQ